jgi:hypothetical protein
MLAQMSYRDLYRGSLGLVRVTVTRIRMRSFLGFPKHDGAIGIRFRDHVVSVTEVLTSRSSIQKGTIALIRTARADSEARFSVGEDAFVFLGPSDSEAFEYEVRHTDDDLLQAPIFRVYGGFQGKFTIEGSAGVTTVSQPGQPRLGVDRFRLTVKEVIQTSAQKTQTAQAKAKFVAKPMRLRTSSS